MSISANGEPEILPLTEDLSLISDGRPSGNGPAWVESGLRRRFLRRLRVAVALAAATVLLWAVGFWAVTRPFHEDWPRTGATVVRTHEYYAKGQHCDVYLRLASAEPPRTVMFSGYAPCSGLPPGGDNVTVAVDPVDQNSVHIIGYDGPLWADIWLPATVFALPVLWASAYLLFVAVRFRRVRKTGGDRPWREVTARFVSRTHYRGIITSRLWAVDAEGKERTFLLSGTATDLPGFASARPGSIMTFWLVGDGGGNVLVSQSGSGRAGTASIRVPNEFELRAMA
ncbi:hypothetical protein AHiyo8_pI67200 (plasmid) [Arthrobacter sp. Hiyo8]|uniref:hypothetical protein n=1 Tax=Arthrobacter sp. Hiyo1 TaxID=1588020 RepID=UPI000683ACB7|nr:hypothetical protein [Arthrobacter sp. Hiyo1]BAS18416.1 hypothetical protein AHiyo8_pI67200 [Arthrobacter sp. Hiyo8]GAP61482.1 hypothetical protein AHiyo1_51870 [Arthrobacter sp. Hiyo1]